MVDNDRGRCRCTRLAYPRRWIPAYQVFVQSIPFGGFVEGMVRRNIHRDGEIASTSRTFELRRETQGEGNLKGLPYRTEFVGGASANTQSEFRISNEWGSSGDSHLGPVKDTSFTPLDRSPPNALYLPESGEESEGDRMERRWKGGSAPWYNEKKRGLRLGNVEGLSQDRIPLGARAGK